MAIDFAKELIAIHEKLDWLIAQKVAEQKAAASGGGSKPSVSKSGGVASDFELDHPLHGDPVVKKDPPRDWTGQSFVGYRFSETVPEFLDALADYHDWCADADDAAGAAGKLYERGKNAGKPKNGHFARLDAKRARGWAKRLRNGWQAPAEQPEEAGAPTGDADGSDETQIPF